MPFNELNEWKPKSKQQAEFLRIPTNIKEALFGGGAGSGKSELLLMYSIVNGWHSIEGFKQVFMRRTMGEIKREIIPRSMQMFPRLGAKFHKGDSVWTFPREDQFGSGMEPSGGMIWFGHCENEDSVHIYDGMEINLFSPDEITSFTEDMYMYIGFTRVRSSNPKLPAIIRCSGMPGDVGHAFVKKRFIDPYPQGSKILVGRGGNKRIYIHSTYADNTAGDPTYGQSLDALPEAERRAKKYGDWSTYEGQVFDELRDRHFSGEPEHALHVIDPFVIPAHWPRICAIDWGYNAMCSVGWAAISPEPRLYVYRHQAFYEQKINEWAQLVKIFVESDSPRDVVVCHSAAQRRGDPHSIQEQVAEALDFNVRVSDRESRISGKVLIHEFLRWKPKPLLTPELAVYDENLAQWIMRNKGLESYKIYIRSFQPQTEEQNLPKLRFLNVPGVELVWNALKMCVYEKTNRDGKKKEDVAEFEGDDPYDMLRMLVHSADQYFNTAQAAQDKLNQLETVLQQYQVTGDNTRFYHNMRILESGKASENRPVSRFHGRRR